MAKYTLTYDEKTKGFTSFHSYYPQWMCSLNNKFYSIYDGNLYIHNSSKVDRNTFYDTSYPSKITIIVNDYPSDNKVFNAINLEGTIAWDVVYTTNMTNGTIDNSEFVEKEKEWYAYLRRSENQTDTSSLSTQGVGEVSSINVNEFSFSNIPENINVGDSLYVYDSGNDLLLEVGIITSYTNTSITTDVVTNPVLVSDFMVVVKNQRAEASEARGYYLQLDLEMSSSSEQELYAVNVDSSKSFQ